MPDKQNYTISQLAEEFGVTTRTIRFYEEKKLIHPERDGQKRIYNPVDRVRLQLILRGKRIGLSLDESLEIIDLYDPAGDNADQYFALIGKIEGKKLQLENQINDIQQMIGDLEKVRQRCKLELKK
jgi:DNA-binding transcriptional MerR regulator